MFDVMGRFARRLAAACHSLCGRLAARLHRPARARRHFERVLSLGGDEFVAYLNLGRLSLAEGNYAAYRREMANARAADPERFGRLQPPIDGLDPRAAGTPFGGTGERATWRSVRASGTPTRRTAVRSAELPSEQQDEAPPSSVGFELPYPDSVETNHSCRGAHAADRRDDFVSNAERARFRRLPPIRVDEVRRADLDGLADRLSSRDPE
jgi:hypothetical protein